MLIICRFMGIAMVTPSTARRNTQASIAGSGRALLVTNMYAAKAEMRVPLVEEPAELAVDCMQLFSRMVMGVRTMPVRCSVVQMLYERMHAVIATPKPQPALKTVVAARHVMGLRAAAFLTAGSARVPFWKFMVADVGAAAFGVPFAFGLAYFFTDQINTIQADVHRVERWLGLAVLLALAVMLANAVWRWNRRVGKERPDPS